MNELEQLYLKHDEPNRSCLLALRDIILEIDAGLSESKKYGMPFFSYKGKMFCYFWFDKKTNLPYIGIMKGSLIDHFMLEKGNRSLVKIFRVNPNEDIPIKELREVLSIAMGLY